MAAETSAIQEQPSQKAVTSYEQWLSREGVSVVRGYGIGDLREPETRYWERLGCPAYFVILRGMEGITSVYVAELPGGGNTERIRHMYEQLIYVLEGSGSAVVEGPDGSRNQFEWQEGSFFAIPLNAPYQLFAAGPGARFIAFTTASMVFDLFHSEEFVFNTPFDFRDRYDGEADYFARDHRDEVATNTLLGFYTRRAWETNFVANLPSAMPDPVDAKKKSLRLIQFEIAGNTLIGHVSKYPVNRYMQGHYHVGGAILMIMRSEGYSLMWPNELGPRPFESGHGDRVARVDWKPGSIFSPPTGWFHQHFNLGNEAALQLAVRHGSHRFPTGIWVAQTGTGDFDGTSVPREEGGTLIRYSEEDPAMWRMYAEALAARGRTPAERDLERG